MECIYQQNGYSNRQEYLEFLSEDYGVELETVLSLAELLGELEDMDGLVSALDDLAGW